MERILDMIKEVLDYAVDSGKNIEMNLRNNKSKALGNLSCTDIEELHVFISSQTPYTLENNENTAEEDEEE